MQEKGYYKHSQQLCLTSFGPEMDPCPLTWVTYMYIVQIKRLGCNNYDIV